MIILDGKKRYLAFGIWSVLILDDCRSVQPNSLSIWTHHLKSIEWFDTSFTPKGCSKPIDGTFMRVGSGGQWKDLNAAAKEKEVVLVSGEFDTVSVGGYLANGGHGGLSAKSVEHTPNDVPC
jgi:hypothetical protein